MNRLIIIFLLCTVAIPGYASDITFLSLKCDALDNPISIENNQPLLSWVVEADGFNRSQTAYQVLVASSPDLLNERKSDVWNSGEIKSSQSTFVKYSGKTLVPTQKYYWKVKIWDEKGKASAWSPVNTFEMGLMNEDQWATAQWISLSNDTRTSEYRFREYQTSTMNEPHTVTSYATAYFRNQIDVTKKIKSARAYICGLGLYELYINGEKTGDHLLDPAPSNYDKQAYYASYDVTGQLQSGKNAIGIILGNGFYGQNISWKNDPESERDLAYGKPAVRLRLKIAYDDGSVEDIITNDNWKNATGPIVFDNIYGGDIYDARYEINGWDKPSFIDDAWENAKVVQPDVNKISAQNMPPIRRLYEFTPQRVYKSSEGKWIVDFGQNMAGWVRIAVNEKEGQEIKITTVETLTQDGKDIFPGTTGGDANGMAQWFKYICKGEGLEVWEPKFSYHGFRFAHIEGISSEPDANTIKAYMVATDMEQTGSFTSSEPLYNKMDTISKWTIIANMHGLPEDCPHREKNGWLGDSHAFCEYALYNYDLLNFYKKYMEDIRTQRRSVEGGDNSGVKYRVPTMIAPGKRTSTIAKLDWGIAYMYLPWYNYLHTGDDSMVLEYYEDVKELTEYYLTFKDEQGIVQDGMGDWCPPRWDRRQNPDAMECHPVVSANAYFYDVLGIMERFAIMNNDPAFTAKMKIEKEALLEAFNTVYLEKIPLVNHYWYGSQTATVMALQFGMVPEDKISSVVNGLAYDIVGVKGGHHATGIHGDRYIYTVLSKYGKADLAHQILTTPTFPSQTYTMNYGFTTWPERRFFWEDMHELTNSLNHPMNSGFSAFFFESLGGIQSCRENVGYKEFSVNPVYSATLTGTTVNVPTSYGNIRNAWEIKDGNFNMNLQVPFNTSANVTVPQNSLQTLTINGISWEAFQKKNSVKMDENGILKIGSGEYLIKYKN